MKHDLITFLLKYQTWKKMEKKKFLGFDRKLKSAYLVKKHENVEMLDTLGTFQHFNKYWGRYKRKSKRSLEIAHFDYE